MSKTPDIHFAEGSLKDPSPFGKAALGALCELHNLIITSCDESAQDRATEILARYGITLTFTPMQ